MKLKILLTLAICGMVFASCNSSSKDDRGDDTQASIIIDPESDDDTDSKNLKFLKKVIEETNETAFPMEAETGVVAVKMYLDDDYVMYLYDVDEDIHDIDSLKSMRSTMKDFIRNTLTSNNETLQLMKYCIKANKGLGYKYVGDTTEESFTIKFSVNKLKEMVADA